MDGRRVMFLAAECLLLLLVAAVPIDSENPPCVVYECPNYSTIHHYQQLGCIRSDDADKCCPTRFNCSSLLSLEKTKCHYRGKAYDPGTIIQQEINYKCIPSCNCSGDEEGTSNGEAKFNCTVIECPLNFVIHPGCTNTYSFDQCCSTGSYCGNPNNGHQKVAECTYNGKKYIEGEYMAGPGCLRCICQAGFNGTLDWPWCREVDCQYSLRLRPSELASCAPVYWDYNNCCPIWFHCPSPNDTLVRRSEPPTDADEQCTFGDHRLKIGDELRSNDSPCVKCQCDIPPFVTCTLISFQKCVT